MSRTGVRGGLAPEEVLAAIESLAAAGITPTFAAVRNTLGRGSYSSIADGLRQWREDRASRSGPRPDDFVLALDQFLDLPRLLRAARGYALSELDGERQALQEDREQIEREMQAAAVKLDEAQDRIAMTEAARKVAEDRANHLSLKNAALESRLQVVQEDLARGEQRMEEIVTGKIEADLRAKVADRRAKKAEEKAREMEEEMAALRERIDGIPAGEWLRLVEWFADSRRKPADTAFTAGACRDAARAFEEAQGQDEGTD